MADRSIRVILRAEVAGFRQAMNEASAAARRAADESTRAGTAAGQMAQSAQRNRQAWDQAGRSLVAFGAIAVGALAFSVKAAMDWETAWTGVLKTVEGTPKQLAAVEDGLRGLARELPISHAEIAAVAEAAGQLGVKTKDVVAFTKVMIDLGQTTNLSAEEAATSLARIANIMGTSAADVSRMGATIVDLGNNSATTEREIVELGTRLAAAGKQAGLSEADVFAFASALTSVGVEAEAGGTAMSKVFTSIADATRDGGASLDTFAKVAGVSASDFKRAFEQDAASAITMFVEGMGRISNAGESTTDVFKDLKLTDSRLKRAILSLGSATGLTAAQVELANHAWEANTALLDEANKRYDTTESKIKSAKGSIADAAISMGESFLPAVAAVAGAVASFADTLGSLPGPLLAITVGGTAVVGGLALLTGAFFLLLPRIIETRVAFATLAADMPRAAAAARGAASALKGIGLTAAAVLGAAMAVGALTNALIGGDAVPKANALEKAIKGVGKGSVDIDELGGQFTNFGKVLGVSVGKVDTLSGAFDMLLKPSTTDQITAFGDGLPGVTSYMEKLQERVTGLDNALTSMIAAGDVEAVKEFQASLMDMGYSAEDINKLLPNTIDGLLGAAEAEKAAAVEADALAVSTGDVAEMTDEAIEAHKKWRDTLLESAASFVSFGDAYDELVQAQIDAAQKTADGTKKTGDVWQDYYDGQTINIDNYVAKLQEQLDAQAAWQTNMTTIAGQVSQATFDELAKLGPEYAGLIDQLAKEPERLKDIDGMFNTGAENANAFADGIESIYMPEFSIDANTDPALTAVGIMQASIDKAAASQPPWLLDADGKPALTMASYLQAEINGKGTALPDWAIGANAAPAILVATGTVNQINGMGATLKVGADTASAEATASNWIDRMKSKFISVPIVAAPAGGVAAVQAKATGGSVVGPGTGTSDSIPALLSNGEHVLTASDVAKAGGQAEVYRLRQAIQAGRLPAFAEGGAVRRRRFASGGEASARSWSNINPQPMQSNSQTITVAAPSLDGMVLRGTLMVNGMEAEMRAVASSVVHEQQRERSGYRGFQS